MIKKEKISSLENLPFSVAFVFTKSVVMMMRNCKEVTKWHSIPHKVMHHKFVKKNQTSQIFQAIPFSNLLSNQSGPPIRADVLTRLSVSGVICK